MKRFEYMVQETSYTEAELNELGKNGWELCGINYNEDARIDIYIFKRLISRGWCR